MFFFILILHLLITPCSVKMKWVQQAIVRPWLGPVVLPCEEMLSECPPAVGFKDSRIKRLRNVVEARTIHLEVSARSEHLRHCEMCDLDKFHQSDSVIYSGHIKLRMKLREAKKAYLSESLYYMEFIGCLFFSLRSRYPQWLRHGQEDEAFVVLTEKLLAQCDDDNLSTLQAAAAYYKSKDGLQFQADAAAYEMLWRGAISDEHLRMFGTIYAMTEALERDRVWDSSYATAGDFPRFNTQITGMQTDLPNLLRKGDLLPSYWL